MQTNKICNLPFMSRFADRLNEALEGKGWKPSKLAEEIGVKPQSIYLLQSGDSTDRQRLSLAMRLCIVRPPTDRELDRFLRLLETSRDYYRAHADAANHLVNRQYAVDQIAAVDQAAWIATVRIILNLDEFLTRE